VYIPKHSLPNQLISKGNGVRSATTQVNIPSRIQSQIGPILVDPDGGNGAATMEIVHETGVHVARARQQISAVVAGVDGEVDEAVDDEDARIVEDGIVDGDVMGTGVAGGGELSGGTVGNGSEVDAVALDEVGGDTVGHRVTDETQVLHADSGNDGSLPGVDLGETDGEDNAGEVSGPIEDSGDAIGAGAGKVDQEQIVVTESSRDESISAPSSGEKLSDHQTDIDIDGEGTQVAGIAEVVLGSVVGVFQVSLSVEVVHGTAEGKGVYDVVNLAPEQVLGELIQEGSGPDEIGNDKSVEFIEVSSVRIEAGEGNRLSSNVLAGGPRLPGSIALRVSVVNSRTRGYNKSVQATGGVTSIVAHLADDPRSRGISVELVGTTAREIVRGVEGGDHVIVQHA